MATKPKDKKSSAAPKAPAEPLVKVDKRQVRLGTGLFLLVAGLFTCLAIISYYVSWKNDQDKFFSSVNLLTYIINGDANSEATNVGGRLGAALAHVLVYKGAGIASLVVGFALTALGLNILYGKKASMAFRYMRWASILLLITAPTLAWLLPGTEVPLGGALGNVTVTYLNGLIGPTGTGMVLFAVIIFFVFVIFALDMRPLMERLKTRLQAAAASVAEEPKFNTPVTQPVTMEQATPETPLTLQQLAALRAEPLPYQEPEMPLKTSSAGNSLKNEGNVKPLFIEEDDDEAIEFGLVERAPLEEDEDDDVPFDLENMELHEPRADDSMTAEEEEYARYITERERPQPLPQVKAPDPEITFEVKHQPEKPAIKHGAHISIGSNEPYAPELDLPDYKFPTLNLLEDRAQSGISVSDEELAHNNQQIVQTLQSFGIEIQHISATVGPTVTLYEIVPAKGVRISKIKNLEDDIALNLAALGIRIIAPIPGRGTIGIEVPNVNKQIVAMQTLLSSDKFVNNKMSLPIALGKKIDNENYIVDLATMPHLLMAGATGQGKSVGINAILVSLLYKKHPSQLKFVMVDPKKVELSIYRTIEKHFLAKLPNEEEPIITDIKKVIYTLRALCDEMDDRYGLLKDAGSRNIKEYNEKFIARKLNPENGHKYLPFIVLVIDEFADLIMTAGKEVELPIARLAQLARAVGIHLIIATQRPSVNVITGTIKANFPARIAFKVSAKVDSRTILDTGGAEQLVGRGDMLISHGSELLRLQCAFVDTPEVESIVEFIGSQRGYPQAHALPEPEMDDDEGGAKNVDLKNRDKLFEECAKTVVQMQSGSTSNLQRRYNLGYNRAGRIMDQLEAAMIVGPAIGSKPREVYIKSEADLEELFEQLGGRA